MVIRVAAEDVESAKHLVVELVGRVGGECVSLQADGEMQVRPHGESNRTLVKTLDAVKRWLEETRIGFADVWVGDRLYRIKPTTASGSSAPAPTRNRRGTSPPGAGSPPRDRRNQCLVAVGLVREVER